jgi:hypothetical protein
MVQTLALHPPVHTAGQVPPGGFPGLPPQVAPLELLDEPVAPDELAAPDELLAPDELPFPDELEVPVDDVDVVPDDAPPPVLLPPSAKCTPGELHPGASTRAPSAASAHPTRDTRNIPHRYHDPRGAVALA